MATLLVLDVLGAGYAVMRALGLAKGASAAGLVPVTGLALLTVVTTCCGLTGAPAPLAGVLILACSVAGLGLAIVDREWLGGSVAAFWREHRLAALLLAAALLVPVASMAIAFGQVEAPFSTHDGAFHVETTDAFRRAAAVATWYPPGLAAVFGAVLQVVPWVDTAAGAAGLGLGLTLLAPLVAFGLGAAIWRNLLAASAGALLVSLTHLFMYYPQVWSGWPQLFGILLVLGLWLVGLRYLEDPDWRWAAMAGGLVGSIVLVHGTELYPSAIILVVLAVAGWRQLPWPRLVQDVVAAAILAAVCAAPYLPVLLHWAGGGGAYQTGNEDGSALEQGAATSALQLLGLFVADAVGVDFPVRIVLVVLGVVWAVRNRVGRTLLVVTGIFGALAVIATLFNGVPLVRSVFAATYPWSLPFRQLTFASIPLAMLAGAGMVLAGTWWAHGVERVRGVAWRRRMQRLGRLLVITWLGLVAAGLTLLLLIEAQADSSFVGDDAGAMAWLAARVGSAVVVNDTFADAGIWAPYKAGARIMFYRSFDDATTRAQRELVLANIGHLEDNPEAAAAACALGAKYVYYGAKNTGWQERAFPSLDEMKASSALGVQVEVGGATVFEISLSC